MNTSLLIICLLILAIAIVIIVLVCKSQTDNFDPTALSKERPLIWFHHVHKAGGTSFIKLAEANGEKLYYKGEARNGMPTNRYGYFIPFGKMTKSEQNDFIRDALRNKTTFMATEFEFPKPEEKYQGTADVIMLRDPAKRLISHLAHLLREPEDPRKDFHTRNPQKLVRENAPFFANVMTKVLAGYPFEFDGELTEKDYQTALKNLKNFDTILILEDPQSLLKMQQYGWRNFNMGMHNESSNRDSETNAKHDTIAKTKEILHSWLGPEYEKKLREMSKFDQLLYNYASNQSYKGFK